MTVFGGPVQGMSFTAAATEKISARKLSVKGIVQGVGFRPFVFQLATRCGVNGTVANTASGVSIHIEGTDLALDLFARDLIQQKPPLAHIVNVTAESVCPAGFPDFTITQSKNTTLRNTLISPDVSICDDCLAELFDPDNRRYRYPFINCTNCGPRYTIIDDIPYDRPSTAMKHFKMCEKCRVEYEDPDNRRFHAQPNACAACGPHVALYDRHRRKIDARDAIDKTADLLKQGCIVAVKGLGGFHLAADARNDKAIARLRQKKQREEKPFAVMSLDLNRIQTYAHIDSTEKKLLTGIRRPVVLLKKKTPNDLSALVAPRNGCFGVMLPYTPLHYLLAGHDFAALVMTSGNVSAEPIAIDNDDAFEKLGHIADYFLIHNRDIVLRSDDSIVRHTAGAGRFIRRSRGYVPVPVFLKLPVRPILACGADLKNTICLTRDDTAFLSQHIGDLENPAALDFLALTARHMQRILDVHPEIGACDLHPDYASTRYAEDRTGLQLVRVQHHHAHIVSCMAENHILDPVIGLAFDGTGYGPDGTIWGGEILIARPGRFERAAHLGCVPMPGGDAAVKEPWRMGVSYLQDAFGADFENMDLPFLKDLPGMKVQIMRQMMAGGINAPSTSSMGRLFDAVAAITGVRNRVFFEGQAAMELEMLAGEMGHGHYEYEWQANGLYRIMPGPIIRGVAMDVVKKVPIPVISAKFHQTLIRLFTDLCLILRKECGLNKVALSGGVFQNSILLTGLVRALGKKNFQVLTHEQVPANDGGISLGQAIVADAVANG